LVAELSDLKIRPTYLFELLAFQSSVDLFVTICSLRSLEKMYVITNMQGKIQKSGHPFRM